MAYHYCLLNRMTPESRCIIPMLWGGDYRLHDLKGPQWQLEIAMETAFLRSFQIMQPITTTPKYGDDASRDSGAIQFCK